MFTFRVLKTQLESTAPCDLLPVANYLDWDENAIEAQVASSAAVIVVLSKISLAQFAMAFVLECLLQYDMVRPILVHGNFLQDKFPPILMSHAHILIF